MVSKTDSFPCAALPSCDWHAFIVTGWNWGGGENAPGRSAAVSGDVWQHCGRGQSKLAVKMLKTPMSDIQLTLYDLCLLRNSTKTSGRTFLMFQTLWSISSTNCSNVGPGTSVCSLFKDYSFTWNICWTLSWFFYLRGQKIKTPSQTPDALNQILKAMDELDDPDKMPFSLNPSVWQKFCLVRRSKIESEQKVIQRNAETSEK